jgi:hypothetical protein
MSTYLALKKPSPSRRASDEGSRLLAGDKPDLVEVGRRLQQAQERGEFAAFCSALSLHTRKAYGLVAIGVAVDAGRMEAGVCADIGWSKAQLIAARATSKREARKAITFARANTLPALVKYFQHESSASSLVTKSFHLTIAEAEELELALQKAGALRSGGRMVNRSKALMTLIRTRPQIRIPLARGQSAAAK